jgi:hypothetical protein
MPGRGGSIRKSVKKNRRERAGFARREKPPGCVRSAESANRRRDGYNARYVLHGLETALKNIGVNRV